LLEQFLNYIEKAGEHDIELAGEFLEAAAHLIYIKSVSLLPKHEAEQLKRELEGALIEYALCKATAERLKELNIGDLIYTRKTLEVEFDMTYNLFHSVNELFEAVGTVADRKAPVHFEPPHQETKINYVSIISKIFFVLKRIRKGGNMKIKDLFIGQGRSEQVAIFMALLELSRGGRITFSKKSDYIEFRQVQ